MDEWRSPESGNEPVYHDLWRCARMGSPSALTAEHSFIYGRVLTKRFTPHVVKVSICGLRAVLRGRWDESEGR